MIFRRAVESDLNAYAAIQSSEWGDEMAADSTQLAHRLAVFPAGMLVAEHEGRVVAGASFMRLTRYDWTDGLSWYDLTDHGWCTNHNPEGSVLFGVDLTVSRQAPRRTTVGMFILAVELTVRLGIAATYWGSRMPRYERHADSMSAEEYLRARNARGRLLDPELAVYSRIPGLEVMGTVSGYFKDPASRDYGAIVRWRNPVYRHRYLRPFAHRLAGPLYNRGRRSLG